MNLFKKHSRLPRPASELLNIGCGRQFHPAWTNLDVSPVDESVIQYDARLPLPFANESFTVVYHSHVLEHLSREEGRAFLSECFRVLKAAGVVRVVVPDLEQITRLYLENLDRALAGDEHSARKYEWMKLELLDQLVREESGGEMAKYWKQNPMPAEEFVLARMGGEARLVIEKLRARPPRERKRVFRSTADVAAFRAKGEIHKWMYDRYSLAVALRAAGFMEPRLCRADESAIPRFIEFHLDTDEQGAVRKPDSLFMEGIKPPA